jgi:hypothetical protein
MKDLGLKIRMHVTSSKFHVKQSLKIRHELSKRIADCLLPPVE